MNQPRRFEAGFRGKILNDALYINLINLQTNKRFLESLLGNVQGNQLREIRAKYDFFHLY